ncbi:hypothetical protein TNCV_848461 [Trichonephila clavipes]|uniref:Uncharacterized protein n=1 Tax=Trichonephila clavipes TaxID=2585209 RepID=A0A8X6RIK2_TRICX|nr:hypothetical protein TNCV_848461 [Trichonephila clavipes]
MLYAVLANDFIKLLQKSGWVARDATRQEMKVRKAIILSWVDNGKNSPMSKSEKSGENPSRTKNARSRALTRQLTSTGPTRSL